MRAFVLGAIGVLLVGGLSVAVAAPKEDAGHSIDYRLVQSHTLYKKGDPREIYRRGSYHSLEKDVRAFLKKTNPKHVVSIAHDSTMTEIATVMGTNKLEGPLSGHDLLHPSGVATLRLGSCAPELRHADLAEGLDGSCVALTRGLGAGKLCALGDLLEGQLLLEAQAHDLASDGIELPERCMEQGVAFPRDGRLVRPASRRADIGRSVERFPRDGRRLCPSNDEASTTPCVSP